MRNRITLLAVAVMLISIGVMFLSHVTAKPEDKGVTVSEKKFEAVLVVDGKEYVIHLVRNGPWLTGNLPPEVQKKYAIKSFVNDGAIVQLLVTKTTTSFKDPHGKRWVEADLVGVKETPTGPGPEGGTLFQWDPTNSMNLTAVVLVNASGDISDGWPPVYS